MSRRARTAPRRAEGRPGRRGRGLSGRAKRVAVYTAGLLLSPVPAMPFERGERGFAWSLLACGALLAAASFYVVRGERRGPRDLLGWKLLASSLITLLFGAGVAAGAAVYLYLV